MAGMMTTIIRGKKWFSLLTENDYTHEMKTPIVDQGNAGPQQSGNISSGPLEQFIKRRNRGIPLLVYFIISMLFALVFVSLMVGYLYSEYLYNEYLASTLNNPIYTRQEILLKSSLIFGAGWMVILVFFLLMARSIHLKFKILIKNANELSQGIFDIDIVKNGPKEVRDLAFALERIRHRLNKKG